MACRFRVRPEDFAHCQASARAFVRNGRVLAVQETSRRYHRGHRISQLLGFLVEGKLPWKAAKQVACRQWLAWLRALLALAVGLAPAPKPADTTRVAGAGAEPVPDDPLERLTPIAPNAPSVVVAWEARAA
jgi:hypothetical protein